MALPNKVVRFTINGTMFGGAEQWSTGFWLGANGVDVAVPDESYVAAVADLWHSFFTASNSGISYLYETTSYRAALHGTDGKGIPGASVNHYESTPVAGGGGGSTLPPQISLVATLGADTPRGLASKGRMYLPGVSLGVSLDGRIGAPGPANIATNLATFFKGVNQIASFDLSVFNVSPGPKPPKLGPGIVRPVTSVRVGNVYDTQRRRRNQLVEVYSSSPV